MPVWETRHRKELKVVKVSHARVLYIPGIDGVPHSGDRFLDLLPDVPERAQFMFPVSRPRHGIAYEPTAYPGKSEQENSGHDARIANLSVEAMADRVAAWMDGQGWGSAIVIGESYGGAVAQMLASRHPGKVDRLVLVASFTRHPARRLGYGVSLLLTGLPRWAVKFPVKAVARLTILRGVDAERRRSYYERTFAMPLDDIGRRIDSLRRFRGRGHARGAEWPKTLWLWGDRDRLVDVRAEAAWLRANHPEDQAVMVEGAGHVISSAHREVFAAHLRAFIGLPPLLAAPEGPAPVAGTAAGSP